jgi:hypothetical protein
VRDLSKPSGAQPDLGSQLAQLFEFEVVLVVGDGGRHPQAAQHRQQMQGPSNSLRELGNSIPSQCQGRDQLLLIVWHSKLHYAVRPRGENEIRVPRLHVPALVCYRAARRSVSCLSRAVRAGDKVPAVKSQAP